MSPPAASFNIFRFNTTYFSMSFFGSQRGLSSCSEKYTNRSGAFPRLEPKVTSWAWQTGVKRNDAIYRIGNASDFIHWS